VIGWATIAATISSLIWLGGFRAAREEMTSWATLGIVEPLRIARIRAALHAVRR
jgi:hypothetical protein